MSWEEGVWLGILRTSSESIIGTREGVIKVRDWRRMGTHAQRWNWETFSQIRGVPWEPVPGRESLEIRSSVYIPGEDDPIPSQIKASDPAPTVIRAEKITKKDLARHGPTKYCRGCDFLMNNRKKPDGKDDYRPHTPACRERFAKIWEEQSDPRSDRVIHRTVVQSGMPLSREDEVTTEEHTN